MTACAPRARSGDDVRAASSMENGWSSRALPAKAPRRRPDAGWAEALPAISCWTNIDVDLIRVIKKLPSFDGKLLNALRWCALAPRSPFRPPRRDGRNGPGSSFLVGCGGSPVLP